MAARLAVASVLLALSACGSGDPFAPTYTRKQPIRQDVVGAYAQAAPGKARVELKTDGGFKADDFDGDAGTWSIVRHQDWWAVELRMGSRSLELMLRGEAPPYRLHRTIGDPDTGDAIVFERMP